MFKADAEAAAQAEQEAEVEALEAAQAEAAPAQQVLDQQQPEEQAFEIQMVCVTNFSQGSLRVKFFVFKTSSTLNLIII